MKKPFAKERSVEPLDQGSEKTRETRDQIDQVRQQITQYQKDLQNAMEKLRSISQEHEQLETAYQDVLRLITEMLLQQELLLQSMQAAQKLLEQQGVERWAPILGDSVPRDKCKVVGLLETDRPSQPGSVAKIVSPGFRFKKDGRIVLLPTVLESVAPPKKGMPTEGTQDKAIA